MRLPHLYLLKLAGSWRMVSPVWPGDQGEEDNFSLPLLVALRWRHASEIPSLVVCVCVCVCVFSPFWFVIEVSVSSASRATIGQSCSFQFSFFNRNSMDAFESVLFFFPSQSPLWSRRSAFLLQRTLLREWSWLIFRRINTIPSSRWIVRLNSIGTREMKPTKMNEYLNEIGSVGKFKKCRHQSIKKTNKSINQRIGINFLLYSSIKLDHAQFIRFNSRVFFPKPGKVFWLAVGPRQSESSIFGFGSGPFPFLFCSSFSYHQRSVNPKKKQNGKWMNWFIFDRHWKSEALLLRSMTTVQKIFFKIKNRKVSLLSVSLVEWNGTTWFQPQPNKAVDTAIAGGENDSRGGRKGFLFFSFSFFFFLVCVFLRFIVRCFLLLLSERDGGRPDVEVPVLLPVSVRILIRTPATRTQRRV